MIPNEGANPDARPLIRFSGAALGYGGKPFLVGLDFIVEHGDFLGIVGPNGSGKTTLLRALLGLLKPLAGSVRMLEAGLHFGYVPQRHSVDASYPLSVTEVVLMGAYRRLGPGRRPGAREHTQAVEALAAAGIPDLGRMLYHDLSGGQKQRALIARALIARPDVLVLDEPSSGMDLRGSEEILALVDQLHAQDDLTVVIVSHHLNSVAKWVKRLGMLHAGKLTLGPVDHILTRQTLTDVYGEGADVVTVRGERVVLPPSSQSGRLHR